MELIEQIKAIRQQEIKDGKNASTVPPLYVVFDVIESACEHNTQYGQSTTHLSEFKSEKFVRADYEGNTIDAEPHRYSTEGTLGDWDSEIEVDGTKYRPVVKVSYHDKFITCAFTRESAERFIELERHNLKHPWIWVEGIERRNFELFELGKLFGDNF